VAGVPVVRGMRIVRCVRVMVGRLVRGAHGEKSAELNREHRDRAAQLRVQALPPIAFIGLPWPKNSAGIRGADMAPGLSAEGWIMRVAG
jgi:hypothetical protein